MEGSIDVLIRKIVREELESLQVKSTQQIKTSNIEKGYEGLPHVITVDEAAEILKMSKSGIYELVHNPTFPAIREGRKIRIITARLFSWLEDRASERSVN